MDDERFFEEIAAGDEGGRERAPASLKARIYTRLIHKQQETGALAPLTRTRESGRRLCVFEQLVAIAPAGEGAKSRFYCSVCHARVLAEHLDNPPIWWPHCPYSEFKKA
ncbi:MAG: hypothetical protein HYZ57_08895 [Acidobacteria bacterium]|nr:hypothetical protein [Acidobacteriota bacterium]MBI3279942.1 hypothetical protein [Acidobacteriota bacterium]